MMMAQKLAGEVAAAGGQRRGGQDHQKQFFHIGFLVCALFFLAFVIAV